AVFDREIMRRTVAPVFLSAKLRHRQQLDGADPQFDQVIEECNGVRESARPRLSVAQRAQVNLVNDQVLDAAGDRPCPRNPVVFILPELVSGDELRFGPDSVGVLEIPVTLSGSTTAEQLVLPSSAVTLPK